jgi:sugar lactone lactonase YvrE
VKHIHNSAPQWGDESMVELELIRTINKEDEIDENYQLYKPHDIEIDDEGNIYILDSGNFRVQKYTKDGTYLTSFRRKGEGPGEFLNGDWIEIDENNNIYIVNNGQAIVLNQENKEIRRIRRDKYEFDSFTILPSGSIVINLYGMLNDNSSLVGILDNDFNYFRGIGIKEKLQDDLSSMMYNATTYTYDKDENLYLTYFVQNRIEKYSIDGGLLFKTNRPINYDLKEVEESFYMEGVSMGIQLDSKGRIWVLTFNQSPLERHKAQSSGQSQEGLSKEQSSNDPDKFSFHIFDPKGVFLGSIPAPNVSFYGSNVPFKIFGERLFFLLTENMEIYEYKIIDK